MEMTQKNRAEQKKTEHKINEMINTWVLMIPRHGS